VGTPVRGRPAARLAAATLAVAATLAACGSGAGGPGDPSADPAADAAADVDPADWDAVLAAAEGGTVNWWLFGGSEGINRFVDETYTPLLAEEYGITLNRVPVADTVDAVNQVLSEEEAEVAEGAVDLIWINGENFLTLKQADLLYGDWSRDIPNAALVDWDNPAVNRDFGEPVEGYESPWSSAQLQLIHDSARTDEADLPRSYAELSEWVRDNPGRFTYVAPGAGGFQGTRFVKGALFEISGGAEQWLEFDQALWDRWAPELWEYLADLEPYLWRAGETYPATENELHALFANGEVDMSITQSVTGAGTLITEGLVPETARAFVFDDYMIGDTNYVAIPSNASNRAAALVLADVLLEPELQARQILPDSGFGLGYGIDVARVEDPDDRAALEESARTLGEAATPAEDLARALAGDSAGEYQVLVEEGWRAEVLIG
jgi:putative spermidine/putrescine transport system substrate-binding protein